MMSCCAGNLLQPKLCHTRLVVRVCALHALLCLDSYLLLQLCRWRPQVQVQQDSLAAQVAQMRTAAKLGQGNPAAAPGGIPPRSADAGTLDRRYEFTAAASTLQSR